MNTDKPMERKTNALAELAEDLDSFWTLERQQRDSVVDKAQRIIAELAKVKITKIHSLKNKEIVEIEYPEREDANIAFLKCRALAEE